MEIDESAGMPARLEYGAEPLDREHLSEQPVELFTRWFSAAVAAGLPEANAFCLCTSDAELGADGRVLLMKGYDGAGFSFFTNFNSAKGQQLLAQSKATMVFWWQALRRQIRISGVVEKLSEVEADEYFASRPRSSQLGAWTSQQSQPVRSRAAILQRYERFESEFPGEVPRPCHWGGYRLRPTRMEFWQGRDGRLHDRFVYLAEPDGAWSAQRLMP